MKTESTLAKMISTAGEKAAYDRACKRLLANKIILAWIMKSCLREYRDCEISEIASKYIEGEAQISEVAVHPDEEATGILRLLEVLLSSERSIEEKKKILQEDFDIKMTQELEREVSEMCNLSDSVEQKGIAKGRAYGIAEGIAMSIRKLMESMGWTIEQAMDALQIPTEERNGYLSMLKK